jgi:hypothetical protein
LPLFLRVENITDYVIRGKNMKRGREKGQKFKKKRKTEERKRKKGGKKKRKWKVKG